MIRGYSDHAANERTFLAWVRTGIAVIAFGLVIEKFNLFLQTLAASTLFGSEPQGRLRRLSEPLGRYEGLALIVGGTLLIMLASARFVRTARRLDAPEEHEPRSVRAELVVSGALVLLVAAYTIYLALL